MKTLLLLVRILLISVSLLYGLLVEIRNILFDLRILPVYKSKIPVVSVGNISAGGTGKTPFTIWLALQLSGRFERIAVVSRGYKRRSKGFKIVAEDGKILCDVYASGDEPMLIAHKLDNALVLVSEKRKTAMKHIEITESADLIILDDAFQHRWVQRDADIVLFKPSYFLDLSPLPTGKLREPIWRLKRATYLILRENGLMNRAVRYVPKERQFKVKFELGEVVNELFEAQGRIEEWKGKRVAAFAGIARPQTFFEMLESKGLKVIATQTFPDHYRYREDDLQKLLRICREEKADWLLCTEKDLVKIQDFLPVLEAEIKIANVRLGAVGLKVKLQNEKEFVRGLMKRLTNR